MAKFRFTKSIPLYVRKHLRKVVFLIEQDIGTTTGLMISVCNGTCIGFAGKVDEAWGAFSIYQNARPKIHMAGHPHEHALHKFFNNKRDLAFLSAVLVHELVHFEQFKSGKKVQERGVKIRMKNLLQKHDLSPDCFSAALLLTV